MADKFQLKALITGVDKLSPTLAGVRKNVAGFRKQLNSTGLGNIGFKDVLQGGAFAAPFIAGAKAAIKYESAMADVRKVVDFDTPEQFQQMSKDVLDLSEKLPVAADGIAAIVAAGGQSKIPREELMAFAADAVKMGIAFDQTADQSGGMMAKWRAAFKMNQAEVVNLADQINYLGNTGAKAGTVANIVTSVGALGGVAGLAAGQVAAMAATLDKVGVSQDVAGTGLQNFMLTLTAGAAATKQQQLAFKALRLDTRELAKGMQKDARGTIEDVLNRISKVDPSKQAGLLTQLFGKESIRPISQLVTSLDILKTNFAAVGDAKIYAKSMEQEFKTRAATTENALVLLQSRFTRLGIEVGNVLLPPLNDVLEIIGPMVTQLSALAAANPAVIKGVIGAAMAYGVLRLAVVASTAAMALFDGVTKKSIVGLVIRGIALAAGLLIANWSTVAPYFQLLWDKIKGPTMAAWELFKVFASYTPMAAIIENWGPLTEFFKALWGVTVALAAPTMDFLKTMFDWSPLGFIVKNWEPISAWFKSLWEKLRPIIEPMMKFFGGGEGGDGLIKTATAKANDFAEAQRIRNAGEGGGTGEFLQANAAQTVKNKQTFRNVTQGGADVSKLLRRPDQPPPVSLLAPGAPGSLLTRPGPLTAPGSLPQQTAQNNRTQLNGEMNIRFTDAPPGLRVDPPKTNQPGLSVKPSVGYRTLGSGGTQ
ncbi:phage tail tape measure protein [Pseudomonas sp. WS 5027]|uniref:phage tail tape measure protein n=1 Tax=Pseudomonas sp. WS 5027 TaxID=2717483 RepID=UPI0014746623|nr:phage tail tape measure protein [Pseudomonas sp. WS 5027]NMY45291.1 phage tail tape measure protein [Pseudomonas sp. WS 5027]